jgi:thioredoxin-related protein
MVLFGALHVLLVIMVYSVSLALQVHLSQNIQMSVVELVKICHLKQIIQQDMSMIVEQCQCVLMNAIKDTFRLKMEILSASVISGFFMINLEAYLFSSF